MKSLITIILVASIFSACSGQEKVSQKKFEDITLVNKIDFVNSKYDQARFSCGFLLKFKTDTFAVTAKHLLKFIKTDDMKSVSFKNIIKEWSLFPLDKKQNLVVTDKLLNENSSELIEAKSTYEEDWLIFSLKQNNSKVKPLEIREATLIPGEKLYVIGWTRKMEEGSQRVYEFEYLKKAGNRIWLKDIIVPEQFGGLSGAPVVDEAGKVVGLVSGPATDPDSGKKYFAPCVMDGIVEFLNSRK